MKLDIPAELKVALLKAVRMLEPNAYGVPVRRMLKAEGHTVSYSFLYMALEQLEKEALLTARAPGGAERGNLTRRMLTLTSEGRKAIPR